MNFRFILLGADSLLWSFEQAQHRITEDVKKILSVFHGPQCTFESAIDVLSEATKRFWIDDLLYHQKIDLLDAILDALGTNRSINQAAKHFSQAIKLKLFLAPNAADAIAERVCSWKERKLGRVGVIVPPHFLRE